VDGVRILVHPPVERRVRRTVESDQDLERLTGGQNLSGQAIQQPPKLGRPTARRTTILILGFIAAISRCIDTARPRLLAATRQGGVFAVEPLEPLNP